MNWDHKDSLVEVDVFMVNTPRWKLLKSTGSN